MNRDISILSKHFDFNADEPSKPVLVESYWMDKEMHLTASCGSFICKLIVEVYEGEVFEIHWPKYIQGLSSELLDEITMKSDEIAEYYPAEMVDDVYGDNY